MGKYKIAIVWRGDHETRRTATPQNNRFHRVFEELLARGIALAPSAYEVGFLSTAHRREHLVRFAGALERALHATEEVAI